jgi:hypothetical protein
VRVSHDGKRSVAFLPGECRAVDAVARARAQEAVARQDHRDRLVGDGLHHRDRDALGFLDGRAPLVAEPLGVLAHFLRGELPAFGR